MKTSLRSKWIGCAVSLTLVNQVAAQTLQVTERGANHRVLESVSQQWDEEGQLVSRTNRVTELANGLHYWEEGQWKETEEVIELLNDGAAALKGPHKVLFNPNLNTAGAVDLETPDGQRFQSQIFGLSYLDTSTGQSVLIAELKDSFGELVASNQVIYPDAFTDFEADVRFTYTKEGFEQDVILRQNPPSPESYGLNPATTHLQVLTEFFDPPQPVNRIDDEGNTNIVREYISANLTDEKLDFGGMSMGSGKAFDLEDEGVVGLPSHRGVGHPVGKQWDSLEGRNFLIESVEYPRLAPDLEQLPEAPPVEEARLLQTVQKLVDIVRSRTDRMEAKVDGSIKQLAQLVPRKGVVVDYVLLNTVTNHIFKGEATYYVSGAVTLSGLTIIEGGTVVKYTNNAQVKIQGWVDCRTDHYRPAVFTSKDDNTVGEAIPGSTGNPTNYYANAALYMDDKASELRHLRIAHAKEAIYYDNDSGDPSRLRHVQIVHCQRGIQPRSTPLFVQNVLMHDVLTNFYNATYSVTVHGEHLTINTADRLNAATGTITLNLTNSLFVGVTNFGAMAGAYNYTNASAVGVLETVGAGNNYLVSGSALRNAGTTNITPRLKKDLALLTTYPPIELTNYTITSATTYSPQAQRDVDTPDIGYHYDPLDYAANLVVVTNATVLLTNGVAIATVGNNGFWLQDYSTLISEGTASQMNRLCRFFNVQEQSYNWGGGTLSSMQTINAYQYGNSPADVECRFTSFDGMHNSGYHLYLNFTNWKFDTLVLKDCQFGSGWLQLGGSGTTINIQNSLFESVTLDIESNPTVTYYNNLNYRGYWGVSSYSGTATVKDNIFDNLNLDQFGTAITHSHNAYVAGTTQLTPTNANDQVLGVVSYIDGPLGRFYQGSSALVNKGSRSATNANLYHHAAHINQTKEATSTVDIGFHYPALSLTNLALAKIATQSSDYSGSHTATNGVNANRLGSFAHTLSSDTNAWWQVDLGTTNFIDTVWIWNRTDSFSNRLSNFNLYVSDNNFSSNDPTTTKATGGVLTYFNGPAAGYPGTYDVRHPGRYVRIQQNAVAPLNIYELEIYTTLYPVDTDGDVFPDYLEDRDGDGAADAGERNWTTSENGTSSGQGLIVFTPIDR